MNQTDPFLKLSYFTIWPWKSKVKITGEIKDQGYIIEAARTWFTKSWGKNIQQKFSNFGFKKNPLTRGTPSKLVDKMCLYEMDPASQWKIQSGHDSVHRRTDGWTDGQGETSIPPSILLMQGYN